MPEGRQPRGVTPRPRVVAAWVQEGLEEPSHIEGQGSGETPLIQGKKQRLHFAGVAVKR